MRESTLLCFAIVLYRLAYAQIVGSQIGGHGNK